MKDPTCTPVPPATTCTPTGGWAFYLHDGRPTYHYSFLGLIRATVTTAEPLPPGDHQVRVEFAYDGDGLGKGGVATI